MKRFICLAVALFLGGLLAACANMSPEQRKETYELRKGVGESPFVGATSPDARRNNHEVFGY